MGGRGGRWGRAFRSEASFEGAHCLAACPPCGGYKIRPYVERPLGSGGGAARGCFRSAAGGAGGGLRLCECDSFRHVSVDLLPLVGRAAPAAAKANAKAASAGEYFEACSPGNFSVKT